MFKFFKSLISSDNDTSSKRFITITATLTILFVGIIDLFTAFEITEYVFDGIITIVLVGLGVVGLEKSKWFTGVKQPPQQPVEEPKKEEPKKEKQLLVEEKKETGI